MAQKKVSDAFKNIFFDVSDGETVSFGAVLQWKSIIRHFCASVECPGNDWRADRTLLRSVWWKCCSGLLPLVEECREMIDLWRLTTMRLRKEYEELRETCFVDPCQVIDSDLKMFDPLGYGKASAVHATDISPQSNDVNDIETTNPWLIFHQDQEFFDSIEKDLNRLYPTGSKPVDFFVQAEVAVILKEVIFMWCKLHPSVGYRQGMHELIAPIFLSLYQDAASIRNEISGTVDECAKSSTKDSNTQATRSLAEDGNIVALLDELLDHRYLAHDCFWIFSRMMDDMTPLFLVNGSVFIDDRLVMNGEHQNSFQYANFFGKQRANGKRTASYMSEIDGNPIVILSQHIQNNLLPRIDMVLFNYMRELEIEAQIYCLRWLRLLFGQIFAIDTTMRIWDSLFAVAYRVKEKLTRKATREEFSIENFVDRMRMLTKDAKSVKLDLSACSLPTSASYVALAMIVLDREKLLNSDYGEAIQHLLQYSEVFDVDKILGTSFKLQRSLEYVHSNQVLNSSETKLEQSASAALKPQVSIDLKGINRSPLVAKNTTFDAQQCTTLVSLTQDLRVLHEHTYQGMSDVIAQIRKQLVDFKAVGHDSQCLELLTTVCSRLDELRNHSFAGLQAASLSEKILSDPENQTVHTTRYIQSESGVNFLSKKSNRKSSPEKGDEI